MGYFGASTAGTGIFMYLMRNSYGVLSMGLPLYMVLSVILLSALHRVDYHRNRSMKNMIFAGWIAFMSSSLVPLIHMFSMPVLYEALLATGVSVGSLCAVAYKSPS